MRSILFAILLLPAACAGRDDRLAARTPGLHVGEVALEAGVPQTALAVAQRRLASDRNDVSALLMQAEALAALGDSDKAAASFRRAVDVAPGQPEGHLGLGRLLLANGRSSEAEAEFRRAMAIAPGDARIMTDLGIALDLEEKHEEAQAAYHSALGITPGLEAARVNLGLSLALGGNPNAGVDILRPIAANPDASRRVRHDLATALAMAGDRSAAERLLRPDLTQEQVVLAIAAYGDLQSPRP